MKKMHRNVVALAALSVSALLPALADQASDKAALRRNYAAIDVLARRGAVSKMGAYLTADFTQHQLNGQVMDKKKTLQQAEKALKMMKMKIAPTKIYSMRITGSRATVEAGGGGTVRQIDPQGKAHSVTIFSRTRDSWVKVGGAWKQRLSEELSQEISLDGQVVSKS